MLRMSARGASVFLVMLLPTPGQARQAQQEQQEQAKKSLGYAVAGEDLRRTI